MPQPSEFDATALDSDENLAKFAEARQKVLDCLAQTEEFPWLTDDGSPGYAAYQELKSALLAQDATFWNPWLAWRERHDADVEFTEASRIRALGDRALATPAAVAVRERLVKELEVRVDLKQFFASLRDILGRSEFLLFRNRQSVANSAIGRSLGELYEKVDKKAPFKIDPGKVLDILGKIVAVVPGPGAKSAAAAINATKTLHQVNAFFSWAADLIRSGNSLPWGRGSANPGTYGNVISTLGDIDTVQTAMFADAREQLSAIKRCIFRRWGRMDHLYTNLLDGRQISADLADYIAGRIDTGWNYVMWQQLVWAMYRIRAQGPVVESRFVFPDRYAIDFDTFDTAHNGKPGEKDRLGYVFKGCIADQDMGGRAPQSEGVVYAYYLRIRLGGDETDRYHFWKYRLVSVDDKVRFTNEMFDYLRDSYGIERRHFLLATHWDPVSKIDGSLFGPAGRYVDPEDNLRLDIGHTLAFDSGHRDATWPDWSPRPHGQSDSPDRIDYTRIVSTASGHGGDVRDAEFKNVHECYKIRWTDGLSRLDTAFADPGDGSRHFFGDGSYVWWNKGVAQPASEDRIKLSGQRQEEVIGHTWLRPMDPGPKGNWPGVWTSGLEASLVVGERQVLFFRMILNLDAEHARPELAVLQYDLATKRTVGKPRPVLEVWPDFPWAGDGVDAAVELFGKHYFFRGGEVVVYDAVAGIDKRAGARVHGPVPAEEHFDTSPNPQWNWADGCSTAWVEGTTLHVVRDEEYLWFNTNGHGSVDAQGLARLKTILTQNGSMHIFDNVLRIGRWKN